MLTACLLAAISHLKSGLACYCTPKLTLSSPITLPPQVPDHHSVISRYLCGSHYSTKSHRCFVTNHRTKPACLSCLSCPVPSHELRTRQHWSDYCGYCCYKAYMPSYLSRCLRHRIHRCACMLGPLRQINPCPFSSSLPYQANSNYDASDRLS